MGVLILLKANIRHKKGSFVSIILLMIIISMSLTSIISLKDNVARSVSTEMDQVDAGDLLVMIKERQLTDDMLENIKNNDMVEIVSICHSLATRECRVGEKKYTSPWFMEKLDSKYRLIKDDLSGYEDNTPILENGEIYLTLGIKSAMPCKIGDTVKIETAFGDYEFRIKGFIAEPVIGSFTIGWKQVFISDDDFEKISAKYDAEKTEEKDGKYDIVSIKQSESCELSQMKFRRQLNLDTGISNHALGSLTKDQTINYTNIYPKIIMGVLIVFIIILLIIVLIVMRHSIITTIKMDYVGLGVLKSQGFTSRKIRLIFILQYFFAQLAGAFIGIMLAIPLTGILGKVFIPIIAVSIESGISTLKVLAAILAVILISSLFIIMATKNVLKISPVKAISGGHDDVYFDSRLNYSINKKILSGSLALRQFTSAKHQYIGILLIVSLLVFFMMTIMVLGNILTSKSAMESLGVITPDLEISYREKLDDQKMEEIENTINDIGKITKKYYMVSKYLSINGEEMLATIYRDPEMIPGMMKGRAPMYDNEIVITEILADELDIKMGDTVKLGFNDEQLEYIISGIFQSTYDIGRTLSLNFEAAKKLGIDKMENAEFCLEDASEAQNIADKLNEKYTDIINAEVTDNDEYLGIYQVTIDATKAVIYSFSVIFTLIVVSMVCKKTFLKERTDIGVYKSLGFISGRLRLQFAVRFFLIAVIGSAVGTVASLVFSQKLIIAMLRLIGVTSLKTSFSVLTFVLPISLICLCFFLFAFIASAKIKKVEVKELVTE